MVSESDEGFREFAKTFWAELVLMKNRIRNLLGRDYQWHSGTYRESLLRSVLSRFLPSSVAVDTGFIYGYGKVPNSKQIDIVLWNKNAYAPIFVADGFVVVPPEAVISVVAVKSRLTSKYLKDDLANVTSVVPLDYEFRTSRYSEEGSLPPISKFILFYESYLRAPTVLKMVYKTYEEYFNGSGRRYREALAKELEIESQDRSPAGRVRVWNAMNRMFVRSISTLEEDASTNFMQFYDENASDNILRVKPYFCRQNRHHTTPLDKFLYDILQSVFVSLGTRGWSSAFAWINQDPVKVDRANTEELTDEKVYLP